MNPPDERASEAERTMRPAGGSIMYDAIALLLRNARLILGVALVVSIATAAALMLLDRAYAASSTIAPEASDARALPLAGLAAQFGISLAGGGEESVDFYGRLLRSRRLLAAAGLSRYSYEEDGETREGTLLELYDIEGDTERERIQKLVNRLEKDVGAGTDVRANLLNITTTAPSPLLAEALNRRLLELMGEFNTQQRQTTAAAERQFIESRLAEAREALAAAESRLRTFREQNRRLGASPELALEADRLQREVDLRQEVYTSLAQSNEQARLDEVRNTPVFTIVDPPERSARPTRGLLSTMLVAVILGAVAGVLVALARESYVRLRTEHPDWYREMRTSGRLRQSRRDGI